MTEREWICVLARNLAVAPALMIAALLAELRLTHGLSWMPGEGRPAPGYGREWP